MLTSNNRKFYLLSFAVLFGITFSCYFSGLSGDFIFDDFPNIVNNHILRGQDSLLSVLYSGQSGLLKRPLSYLSFYFNITTTGYDPFYFKLTNLLLHFANSYLVFLISQLIFSCFIKVENQRNKLALLVFAIFLLHPLALTSILYIVQRMTSLTALLVDHT